ncbi:MAG: AAA family ATPase, partial [Acidimicrobiaceae bacterium]|nr:AAA family ATPase [Acidimicrobiaceae bacterium]
MLKRLQTKIKWIVISFSTSEKVHVSVNPDLAKEQTFLDRANDRLEAMRKSAREMMDSALGTPRGGTHQARAERDVIVRQSLARLEQLEIGDQALSFGGIDYDVPLGQVATFHIGRLAVADVDMEPLVVDWRAPVAEPFYRATGKDAMGLSRRRHFALESHEVVSIEDEFFTSDDGNEGSDELRLTGPGSLFASVTRARTGRMADIVSTIQAQQDEIIRSPLSGILVVQGGPGTGKTAVALHRAAYLLYTYRMRLERQGVLVVAPNRIFARYIAQVLPSLGETGVQIMTIHGLAGFGVAKLAESDEEALLKGDLRMAGVIAKAIRDRERPLKHSEDIVMGAFVIKVVPNDTAEAVKATKRRSGTHNQRRRFIESFLAVKIAEKYLAA